MSRVIKLGQDRFGAKLYAETDSDGFRVEIEGPFFTIYGMCVSGRANLEALAELVAEALAALPEVEAE